VGVVTVDDVVRRYLALGLELGRHVDGLVDAYYGPDDLKTELDALPARSPRSIAIELRALLSDLDSGSGHLALGRRRWMRAQVAGLRVVAMRLAGEPLRYSDEVEACYGVRPRRVTEDELAAAHKSLDEALPGTGALAERYVAWRESHAVPVDKLEAVVRSLSEDLRERTQAMFGLPEGERVDWELVTDKPWSGFNYYQGDLRSKVAINTDLPVLSLSLAQLVSHEAYPGHHTEHVRKEAGLVRERDQLEETIALIGTPQCLVTEGLADLGGEVVLGDSADTVLAEHLQAQGISYDADVAAQTRRAGEVLGRVRGNAALALHEGGRDPDTVADLLAKWALLPRERADKAVEFLTDPTWRAYVSCYIEGLPLCRAFVNGDPRNFGLLLTEQLTPNDLRKGASAAPTPLPAEKPAPVPELEEAPPPARVGAIEAETEARPVRTGPPRLALHANRRRR
jgi:hypothetical protein